MKRLPLQTLDYAFITALAEIGELGDQKHADHHYQNVPRLLDRDCLIHAIEHIAQFKYRSAHDLGHRKYHLAAAAFNLMMEYHWLEKEEDDPNR